MAYHYWIWYQGRPVRGGLVSLRAPADRCDAQSVIEAIELQTEISIAGVGVGGTVDAVDGWNLAPDPYGDHGRGAADRLGWADLPPRYPHDRPSARDPEAVRRPVREGNRDHDHDREGNRDHDHDRDSDRDSERDRDRDQDPVRD